MAAAAVYGSAVCGAGAGVLRYGWKIVAVVVACNFFADPRGLPLGRGGGGGSDSDSCSLARFGGLPLQGRGDSGRDSGITAAAAVYGNTIRCAGARTSRCGLRYGRELSVCETGFRQRGGNNSPDCKSFRTGD